MKQLKDIHGIGISKAKELIQMGVMSVDDLVRPIYFNKLRKESQYYLQFKPIDKIPNKTVGSIEYQMKIIMNIF